MEWCAVVGVLDFLVRARTHFTIHLIFNDDNGGTAGRRIQYSTSPETIEYELKMKCVDVWCALCTLCSVFASSNKINKIKIQKNKYHFRCVVVPRSMAHRDFLRSHSTCVCVCWAWYTIMFEWCVLYAYLFESVCGFVRVKKQRKKRRNIEKVNSCLWNMEVFCCLRRMCDTWISKRARAKRPSKQKQNVDK